MSRYTIPLAVLLGVLTAGCDAKPVPNAGCNTNAADEAALPRPKVPGKLRLTLRERPGPKDAKATEARERGAEWPAAETAIIICDMWDDLYCKSAVQRIGVMVPRMNEAITHARSNGVQVIHAPSGTVDIYADTAFRKRVQRAKAAKPPAPQESWCHLDPGREPPLPVETEKCACDDPVVGAFVRKYTRQHAGLDITGYDGVSDSGPEIYNFLVQEGVKNVAIMGVHTNMCVLGRPFGIRQLVKLGFNVVLVRDLTDAMYDPRQPPHVSHARGTELVVEHIERYWCPSILAADLTRAAP
ncbi:MAG TPA: isochorismatase family protein [Gemmataceae bacterium]|nr:isochorismatase family protein [Gemmataceae bacterium]